MSTNRVPFRSLTHSINLPSADGVEPQFHHHPQQQQQQQPSKQKEQQVVHLKVSETLAKLVRELKDNPCHNKIRLFKVIPVEDEFCLVDGSIVHDVDKWQVDYWKNIYLMIKKNEIAFVFLKIDDLFYSAKPKWTMIYYCPEGVAPSSSTYPFSHIKLLCSFEHNQKTLRSLFYRSLFGVLKAVNLLQLRLDNLLLWMAHQEHHDICRIDEDAKRWPPPIPLGTEFHIPTRRETRKLAKKKNLKRKHNDDD